MVSIIIPVYNVKDYIVKCLQSVAEQTYEGAMECLIIDDCGQDESMMLAGKFVREYKGNIDFRIIHHDQNKGLSGARNTGIRAAKGEYLYFLDSDDAITADCISSLWEMVERYPSVECVFAGAKATMGFEFMDYAKKDLPEYSDDRNWIQEGMLKRDLFSMTAWNRLVSAEFVRKNNLYFEEGFVYEDEIWNLVISQVIKRAAFVRKNTYCYNVREDSIVTSVRDYETILRRRMRMWNKMLDCVRGYHTERQVVMIYDFSENGVREFDTFRQYFKWQWLVLRAFFMMPSDTRKCIKHRIHDKSLYFLKCYVYKLVYGK